MHLCSLPLVKSLMLMALFLAAPLRAELLATFQTTKGDVVVVLQYDKTPQTVANFITLAQATRKRIDPLTGAVIRKPLYAGEKFFRVLNDPGFRIAQTGSGTGTNSGGPGYTFRDEFNSSLTHVPYVLSMANTGARHDNGSQIFLTGSDSIPSLNNKHTVFGLITDSASRTVIDAIMASGNNGTTINNLVFSRTDAAAVAFNEHAQKLPVCSGTPGALEVVPGVSATYQLASPQPGGSIFQVYTSSDLQSWSWLGRLYQGWGQVGVGEIGIGSASAPRMFYNVPLVTYPDALAPASMANRTLVMGLFNPVQTFTYQFNASGTGGTVTYSGDSKGPTPFTLFSYTPEGPYAAEWVVESQEYTPLRFSGLLNSETVTHVIGTNTSEYYTQPSGMPLGWYSLSSGLLTLSK